MVKNFFNKIRDLQTFIREEGLGGAMLALPAPKLLLLPAPDAEESREETLFTQFVTESEITDVCSDLFQSGFYSQAVEEAFKALEKYIRTKSGLKKQSGSTLINNAFSPSKPVLHWTDRLTISEEDEHRGYHMIYSGGFVGIRNPVAHENGWIDDHTTALDAILLAQHLLRKAKASSVAIPKD